MSLQHIQSALLGPPHIEACLHRICWIWMNLGINQKHLRMSSNPLVLVGQIGKSYLLNNSTSSAKQRQFSLKVLHFAWNPNPWCFSTWLIILVKHSMHIINSMWDMGSPCMSPLLPVIFPYRPSLIAMEYLTVVVQFITHLMNWCGKFKACSISSTDSHSIISYAFFKIIFIKQLLVACFLLYNLTRSW